MLDLNASTWVWPITLAADGRKPEISDGFHPVGDVTHRGGVGHRGQDIMYRKHAASPAASPWSSKWYEMLPHTQALAANEGTIFRVGELDTGWHVIIEHADHIGTAYHHLSKVLDNVHVGDSVVAGQPLGIVGSPPHGYQLAHLHFDVALNGKFLDAAKYMKRWKYLPHELASNS